MEEKHTNQKEESMFWVYVIFGLILFPITIPLITNVLIYRINVKNYLFNKTNLKYYQFGWKTFYPTTLNLICFLIYGTTLLLSMLFLCGVFTTYFSKLGFAFAVLFAIAGIFLTIIGLIWLFILKFLFSKRKQKLLDEKEFKKRMLEEEKITKEHFKKENKFFNWVFCLDLKDKQIYELEKINQIKQKENIKGVFLNKECFIPEKALNKHTSIIGGTGSGKTTTAKHFIKSALENDWNFIFLDGKADNDLKNELNDLSLKFNKNLLIWGKDTNNESFKYNPFKNKTQAEIISIIMESFDYSKIVFGDNQGVAYYKIMEKSILDTVLPYALKINETINFFVLEKWTNKSWILEIIQNKEYQKKLFDIENNDILFEKINNLKEQLNKYDEKIWSSLNAKMKSLNENFSISKNKSSKSIKELLMDNSSKHIYFSIPTMTDPINAVFLAKTILLDIKQSAKENQNSKRKTLLFFDEFGSYASNVLTELLLQGRSYGYCVVLLYQGIAEIKKVSKEFCENILNNTTTKISHRVQEIEGAEIIASLFGTKKVLISTKQTGFSETQSDDLTGTGSVRVGDSFVFNPNIIKTKLKTGECIVLTEDLNGNVLIYEDIQKVDFI